MKALVVDDNQNNLNVIATLLGKEGVDALKVLHPRDIFTTLDDAQTVAIVFLDLELPQQDGFELLNQIRQHPAAANAPIIAYTVHISEINVVHDKGFDGFIGKPLDPNRFPDQLSRILNGESVWETA